MMDYRWTRHHDEWINIGGGNVESLREPSPLPGTGGSLVRGEMTLASGKRYSLEADQFLAYAALLGVPLSEATAANDKHLTKGRST